MRLGKLVLCCAVFALAMLVAKSTLFACRLRPRSLQPGRLISNNPASSPALLCPSPKRSEAKTTRSSATAVQGRSLAGQHF